mmetsp:Transcript_26086/g.43078  ORF Transcript_26086/g.43078 Transcript_26086/m.43078 type:complete len:379 (-) Transcript_26086:230-1366(-)|eukprot:CAMPEP_0119302570 /NCGR_PEP_ID=MMETSP1333-20130426/4148_1 /TAXON_ID=418940 /ORGANISM="Scyphosphaera apsteinii, Strain RCC1455" /LENGTH=378 /DNA_ID=CAMNT_0007304967 /DNA_START=97 /DNA_END=1233 /DNA_ORIENTATION=-
MLQFLLVLAQISPGAENDLKIVKLARKRLRAAAGCAEPTGLQLQIAAAQGKCVPDNGSALAVKEGYYDVCTGPSRRRVIRAQRFQDIYLSFEHVLDPAGFWPPMWEAPTFAAMRLYLTPRSTLVDLGTWMGHFTLCGGLLARRVIGVEADPAAYAETTNNVQLSQQHLTASVEVLHMAVAPKCTPGEEVPMIGAAGSSTPHPLRPGRRGAPSGSLGQWAVPCITVPSLFMMQQISFGPETMIKMDIEATEFELFEGGLTDWLLERGSLKPHLHLSTHDQSPGPSPTPSQWGAIQRLMLNYKYVTCACKGLGTREVLPHGSKRPHPQPFWSYCSLDRSKRRDMTNAYRLRQHCNREGNIEYMFSDTHMPQGDAYVRLVE